MQDLIMKVMAQSHCFMINIDNYNLSLLLLLPLISNDGEDYTLYIPRSEEQSLYNGYSCDVNRPWLLNHLIVLFDSEKRNTLKLDRIDGNPAKINYADICISDSFYGMYTFQMPDEYKQECELIRSNRPNELSLDVKLKILTFWRTNATSKLFSTLFHAGKPDINIQAEEMPEETYIPQKYVILSGGFSV